MSWDIAFKAISFYLKHSPQDNLRLKFFGGEPLLEINLIKRIVNFLKAKSDTISYHVTTNGLLLTGDNANFIKRNSAIELWYTPHPHHEKNNIIKIFPCCGVNIFITPKQAGQLTERFLYFFSKGFRRFNFLPAYFCHWKEDELNLLHCEFGILAGIIKRFNKEGVHIEIKNISSFSKTPLFNDGLVIDCNGDIFNNNFILSKYFDHLKDKFLIGNVAQVGSIRFRKRNDLMSLFRQVLAPKVYDATLMVDQHLTHFVGLLKV
jgi:sulfatase maturation enzyme AslB (radical SAM superfamily)